MEPLAGKVAVVTGASRGVGKAIALELAELGADVAVTARTVEPRGDDLVGTIGETAAAIAATGVRALAVGADLHLGADVDRLVTTVLETFGHVDILVNNAADTGDNVFRGFWDTTPEDWAAQFQINVHAMYALMHGFAPGMRDHGGGLIVNLGSMREVPEGLTGMGEIAPGVRLGAAYPTTKVTIFTLSTLLAQELSEASIAVVTLNPGGAATEMFAHHARELGWDPSMGTPVAMPAKTVGYLATCDDPMVYAATFVDAVNFSQEQGLVPSL